MSEPATTTPSAPVSPRPAALHTALVTAPLAALFLAGALRRWMSDDGFINCRVAQNILDGNGPVFNIGERVEAVTSPLWIAVITVAGALRIPLSFAAVWLGIALGVLGCAAALRASFDIAEAPAASPRAAGAGAFVPFGLMAFAAMPAAWDYLSSGLENGLSYAWIGLSFATLARLARRADDAPTTPSSRPAVLRAGALLGLAPLVRPDLTVAAGLFGLVLLALSLRARSWADRAKTAALLALATGAAPVGYQVFRMGYYATVSPNTALAKEAFQSNWPQGLFYLQNLVDTYQLLFPAGLVFAVTLRVLWSLSARRRAMTAALVGAALLASALCATYVVRVGGDFMHARMLMPATFLALVSAWAIPLRDHGTRATHALMTALLAVWAVVCAAALRMTVENQHHIGDERGWYVRGSQLAHPTALEDYRRFFFYTEGEALLAVAKQRCPGGAIPPPGPLPAGCERAVYIDQNEYGGVWSNNTPRPLDPAAVSSGVVMVAARHAMGIIGRLLGPRVHLVDRAGLADPIASRLELLVRGRPGHEKTLTNEWIVARFAAPSPQDDPALVTARRVLRCGDVAELDHALRDPMTVGRFVRNLRLSGRLSRLRIPADPWAAEERLCRGGRHTVAVRGGATGVPFRVDCPPGTAVSALLATLNTQGPQTLGQVGVECRRASWRDDLLRLGDDEGAQRVGRGVGTEARVTCAEGEVFAGIQGSSGQLVDRVGALCVRARTRGAGAVRPAESIGGGGGAPWELRCPDGAVLVGLSGRAGDLIDAVGPVCAPVADVVAR